MSINYGRGAYPETETPRDVKNDPDAEIDSEERDLESRRSPNSLQGETPAQILADDETRAPEEEGGDDPQPDR